jgi:acyl-CoA thioesterase-1
MKVCRIESINKSELSSESHLSRRHEPSTSIMRQKRIIFALLLLSLVQISITGAENNSPVPVKIICIGDSITQGGFINDEEFTYRLPLYRLLRKRGVNVDFIGTRKEGLNVAFRWPGDFDPDHEGFYGATTEEVRHSLETDLPKIPAPDIAVIELGSNDQGKDIRTAVVDPLENIIYQLRARNSAIKILILQVPGTFRNFDMHLGIWWMAHQLNQATSPITTIPLYLGWNTKDDTFDGSHPNLKGQNKIAAAILSELALILKLE